MMRVLTNIVVGFFRFWYDFIIGDCWQIAAGVAFVLLAAVFALRGQLVSEALLPFLVSGAVVVLVVFTVLAELRRKAARP